MKISPFKLERWFARYEFNVKHLLCCSDCESLSVEELLALEEGAAEELRRLRLGYTESRGDPELRAEIARQYARIGAEDVLVHAGAEEAVFNFMQVVLERGDHVIVHYPCYQSLGEVALAVGCEVTKWEAHEADGWELDPEFVARALRSNTKAVVINCPHNPTGWLMKPDGLAHLVRLSQKHGFIVFSDEVYRGLEYDARERLPALCDLDERGVSLGVMSKSFGLAGLRIGWIATRNKELYHDLAAFKDYTTICSSAPSEYLAALALRHAEQVVGRNLEIIKGNLPVLDKSFDKHPDKFVWRKPRAGPIAFPRYIGKEGVEQFCRELVTEAGVLLLPGTVYGPGFGNFRIGFGRRSMPEALEKLEEFLEARNVK